MKTILQWAKNFLPNQWPEGEVYYILRPLDGVKFGTLPNEDPGQGRVAYLKTTDELGDLYRAVCDFCGGNCGQCGTSIGQGVPFNFDHIILKSEMWKGTPAGLRR